MKIKITMVLAMGLLLMFVSNRAAHAGYWIKTYGGGEEELGNSIQATPDGGYIAVGKSCCYGPSNAFLWVIKIDQEGNVEWQKSFSDPGPGVEGAQPVVRVTSNKTYIIASAVESFGAGGWDMWVVRLDKVGKVIWEKTYGTVNSEVQTTQIEQTSDKGFILLGSTSFGISDEDLWLLKLDSGGNVEWEKAYDGGGGDGHMFGANAIQQTTDGGYIIATTTRDGQATLPWILKLDASGNVTWHKAWCYKDGDDCNFEGYAPFSILETSGGGYLVAGHAGGIDAKTIGSDDIWVAKLDGDGDLQWQKIYGETDTDRAYSALETPDGDYIVAGTTYSFGAGGTDGLILKLDGDGSVLWQKSYGGAGGDGFARDLQANPDGGFTAVGNSNSFHGPGMGGPELWVAKLDADGDCPGCPYIGTADVAVVDVRWIDRPQTLTVRTPSAIVTEPEAVVSTTDRASFEACYFGHDLAVTDINVPGSVNAASPVTESVNVEIQNRSAHDETIEEADLGDGTATGMVRLAVNVEDNDGEGCNAAVVVLDSAKNSKTFAKGPKVLKPEKKLKVYYLVTYDCSAAKPKNSKDTTRGDYSHTASVHRDVLDGKADDDPEDDVCPRSVTPPYEIDPFPDASIKDKGCGSKKDDGTYGAPVMTDVVGSS